MMLFIVHKNMYPSQRREDGIVMKNQLIASMEVIPPAAAARPWVPA